MRRKKPQTPLSADKVGVGCTSEVYVMNAICAIYRYTKREKRESLVWGEICLHHAQKPYCQTALPSKRRHWTDSCLAAVILTQQ